MTRAAFLAFAATVSLGGSWAHGQPTVTRPPPVSLTTCPAEVIEAATTDKQTAKAVSRKPPGKGPFPVIVILHGGLNQRNVDRVKPEAPNMPTNSRFLSAGYVTVEAIFRSLSDDPKSKDALMDCLAIIDRVKKLPEVDPTSVVVLGHSGGGSLALERAGETPLAAIATEDGKVYEGLVVYEAVDSLILQTGPATTIRLINKQISARRFTQTSMMPVGLRDKLSDSEIADLYVYLKSLGSSAAKQR